MLKHRPSPATVIALLALFFAVSGSAVAAFKITSTKQISPAVLKKLKGNAGPRGLPGPAGPTGSQGPAGPVALSALTIPTSTPVANNGGQGREGTATATCPAGTHAVSGGGKMDDGNGDGIDISMMSADHQSWSVAAFNSGPAGDPGTIVAQVTCAAAGQAVAANASSTRAAHARAVREIKAIVAKMGRNRARG
jgi:hypothetical protein